MQVNLDRQQAGFTLLELIIAITLMGLMLVVLYGGLRVSLNSWEGGERRAEQTNRLRTVQEFLRRQLQQSLTVYQKTEENTDENDADRLRRRSRQRREVVFSGQPNMIEFIAPMMAYLGQGGLYRLRIEADQDQRLWIRWRPYLPNVSDAGELQETMLLEGVSKITWSYFGLEDGANRRRDTKVQPQWYSEWNSVRRRPQLVRLNLELKGEPWPDLVVALTDGSWR